MESNIKQRIIDCNTEPIHNCSLCDITSTSLECSTMYELKSEAFEPHSKKEHPVVYLCKQCIFHLM